MKILNIGSLNIDKVYRVERIAMEGETILSSLYEEHLGGKGLNQSAALKAAGGNVWHCGAIGCDGIILKDFLDKCGVNTDFIKIVGETSGHAVIQVDKNGKNCIIVCGGANQKIEESFIKNTLENFSSGDFLLLQNEISNAPAAILEAKRKQMKVVFNPSPITAELFEYPLEFVDIFILNETEGKALSKCASGFEDIFKSLCFKYPKSIIVLTLGEKGVLFKSGGKERLQEAYKVKAVDTTAAGDSFCGYFVSAIAQNFPIEKSILYACAAAALTVSVKGAAESIPNLKDTEKFLKSVSGKGLNAE
ncbi:MAG: ribokinase [Elusimicrobiota bacterium]|jgi:ribokinase|nr:ribokinase [Elusimicrobiota bacterium]